MSYDPSRSLLNRTLDGLREGWRRISRAADADLLHLHPALPDSDLAPLRTRMQDCLTGRGGEVSARARAATLGQAYLGLDERGRGRFLHLMATEFAVDGDAAQAAARGYADAAAADRDHSLRELRAQLRAPYTKLLTQFNALPSGVSFLVGLREDLLGRRRDDPALAALERALHRLLVSWFDIGFLDLKRITWDEPASLLEKLIAYEAVHQIRSWDDLKHRLDGDRRCYAFFHPRMPGEPLIFVQVALVTGLATGIQPLLDDSAAARDPAEADTAIFYSISNTQSGLRGVHLGDFLIKRVVDDLSRRLPNLKTYATLSPIPGFTAFLGRWLADPDADLASTDECAAMAAALKNPTAPWHTDAAQVAALRPPLMRLCAHYLLQDKGAAGRAADRVANFHLSNGARVQQINWLGDCSAAGMQKSLGLMVNYRYHLPDMEENHEAYATHGEIPTSSEVRKLLKK